MKIADKIKALRKRANLTQTELGEKLGVKKNAVSKWECGRVDDIPASKIKAMSVLFGVPISYLVDDDDTAGGTAERVTDEEIKFALFGGDGEITDEMYEEVKRFAAYVKERQKKG